LERTTHASRPSEHLCASKRKNDNFRLNNIIAKKGVNGAQIEFGISKRDLLNFINLEDKREAKVKQVMD
jgi:hypothetical protein